MTDRPDDPAAGLGAVTAAVHTEFGGLTVEQLNWTQAAGSWSVAQCLDHLITMNSLYFPDFEALRNGDYLPSFVARRSPFSGPLGRALIAASRPGNSRKVRTGARAQPSSSRIAGDIIDRFAAHQEQLVEHLHAIPAAVDRGRTILTSPLVGFITYSLADCITLIVVHEQRHLEQARRVLTAPDFPPSAPDGPE